MKKLTETDILDAQKKWADSLVKAGEIEESGRELFLFAKRTLFHLYGFGEREVLFKPTKARVTRFRSTVEEAISYFIGGSLAEDEGFARNRFKEVTFSNYKIIIHCDEAFVNGTYHFLFPDGNQISADYTIGYYLSEAGHAKIFLHHSSFSF